MIIRDGTSSTLGEGFWIPEPNLPHVFAVAKTTYAYPGVTKIGALALLGLGFWALRGKPLAVSLLAMVVIGFPFVVLLVSFYKPILLSRVIAWTSVIAVLVMAAGALSLSGLWRWAAVLFLLLAQVSNLARTYPAERRVPDYVAFAPVLEEFDPGRMVLVLDTQRHEPPLHWYYPEILGPSVFGFREGDRIVDTFYPLYRSTYVPRAEVGHIPLVGKDLVVLRGIHRSLSIPDEDLVDSALAVLVAGRQASVSIIGRDMRLDLYSAH